MLPAGALDFSGSRLSNDVSLVIPIELTGGGWLGSSFAFGVQGHYGFAHAVYSGPSCCIYAYHWRTAVWGEWIGVPPVSRAEARSSA